MSQSFYLEKLIEKCNKARKPVAKRTLYSVIIILFIAIAAYIGISSAAPDDTFTPIMFPSFLGLMALIFFIRYLKLNGDINDKIIMKCKQEIEKNLKTSESFETFDNDMLHPAYGTHIVNDTTVIVGRIFVLFQRENLNGPSFNILRGDNLGIFKVHYEADNIGVDIRDKNDKFIRSIMTSNKNQFYSFLNAMENIKHYANGEDIVEQQTLNTDDDPFVKELKNRVNSGDKKGLIKAGILGIVFGIFLCIAANSSGAVFAYGGLSLIALSIAFIIGVLIKFKRN